MKKIPHDPRFDHVRYMHTDLRATFARIKREQQSKPAPTGTVVDIKRRKV